MYPFFLVFLVVAITNILKSILSLKVTLMCILVADAQPKTSGLDIIILEAVYVILDNFQKNIPFKDLNLPDFLAKKS